jgi:hypothetical protein
MKLTSEGRELATGSRKKKAYLIDELWHPAALEQIQHGL